MSEMSPAEEVFFAALEYPSPTGRAAYLDAACAGRPELRARVEKLLAAHPRVGGFLDSGVPGEATPTFGAGEHAATGTFEAADPAATGTYRPDAEAAGAVVAGRYKLLQPIGEGGMGTVWMADQTEPVKRRVAVKLIRTERGQSKTILSRFEAERQAIALMDHPNIAKLLDAGTTDAGAPFFVMELVRGVPLNEHCDTHKLSVPDRLALFVQICGAVQHAHQKGVIHRDLKPSNILVESHDGKPVPKVIDFGLAKATTGLQLTEHTLFTGFGSVMGTPLYMAPEQATFNAVDVDTRADVYALGVILYELLTGTTPLTRDTIKKAALDEMLRLIREQDAPTPSSRLSTSDSKPSVAANRQTEPAKLGRFVKGELDWIVLKALAKDRDRRYESATGFARDIERFLNHEPVTAGPPSARYRLKKFVRRNRPQVIAAGLVLFVLVAGIAGTTWGLLEARRQEAEARRHEGIAREEAGKKESALQSEVEQRKIATANEVRAVAAAAAQKKATERAERVMSFLATKLLGQADPSENPVGDKLTVRQLLDRAAAEIDKEGLPPEAEGPIRAVIGKTYAGLGLDHLAEPHLRMAVAQAIRAEGPDSDAAIDATNDLVFVLRAVDKAAEAERLTRELLARVQERKGDDGKVLDVKNALAVILQDTGHLDEAIRLFREALAATEAAKGRDAETTLVSAVNLVTALRKSNAPARQAEGEKLLRAYLPDMKVKWANKPGLFIAYNELSLLLLDRGAYQEAEENCRKIIADAPGVVGPKADLVLNARNNLALLLTTLGRYADSEKLFRETAAIEAELPISERSKLITRFNLARAVFRQDRVGESLPLFRAVRSSLGELVPADHPERLLVSGATADAELAAGNAVAAEALSRDNLRLAVESAEAETRQAAAEFRVDLGWALLEQGRAAEAETEFAAAVAAFRRDRPDRPDLPDAQSAVGLAILAQGRYAEAEEPLAGGFRGFKKHLPSMPPRARFRALEAADRLAALYRATGRREQADRVVAERLALAGGIGRVPAVSLARSGRALLGGGAFAEAEPLLRECLTARQKVEPDAWTTFDTQSLLGGALLGQKKYAEAEPLLLKGYEGLKAREKAIPPQAATRLPEANERLIELYAAWGKPDEAAKWRAERAKYPFVAPPPRAKK